MVAPFLDKAVRLTPNKINIDDVFEGANRQIYTIWVVSKNDKKIVASIATRVIEYPRTKAFAIEFVGGSKMKEWINTVLDTMDEVAKHNGCTHVEGYGRQAWMKYLGNRGFKAAFTTFERDLTDG